MGNNWAKVHSFFICTTKLFPTHPGIGVWAILISDLYVPLEKTLKIKNFYKYLSRTAMVIFSWLHFLRTFMHLSVSHPAVFCPSICKIWSPKRNPARAAGEPTWTNATNIPYKNNWVWNCAFLGLCSCVAKCNKTVLV